MKKLLLMIVPLLLLFGVGFADTFQYGTYYSSTSLISSYTNGSFYILGATGNSINLYSVYLTDDQNCTQWELYSGNNNTTLIKSGFYQPATQETIVDVNLTPGQYSRLQFSGGVSCQHRTQIGLDLPPVNTGFFILGKGLASASKPTSFGRGRTSYGPAIFVFSGTDPRIASNNITIHYNGTSTGYAGTELYIDQPVKETYMSGGFLHFIVQRFRTLFRVN